MNPGSDEAIEHGCTCPVLDNGHGSDVIGDTRGFIVEFGCPLHGAYVEYEKERTE